MKLRNLVQTLFLMLPTTVMSQVVGAIPDSVQLTRPFGTWDAETFRNPDKIYYPETWFHFINGNVDRQGVTMDLEAIAEAGITGVSFFHGQRGNNTDWPGTKEHTECLSPRWESLLNHTASEAKRLGLRFTMQTCPGWAMSGGPWIKPEQSMRHLTFVRMDVQGGTLINAKLEHKQTEDWKNYKDLMVLAFPTPLGDTGTHLQAKAVQAVEGKDKWLECVNGMLKGSFGLNPSTPGKPHVIEVELPREETVRTLEFNPIDAFNHEFGVDPGIRVKMTALMSDGTEKLQLDSPMPYANWQDNQFTMSFALDEAKAVKFRIEIQNQHPMQISRMRLYSAARKNNWEGEAGWTLRSVLRENEHPQQDASAYVLSSKIQDITAQMKVDGTLQWNAPEGQWTILRIGHVNTGMKNGPAPAEATGWEVNKFDSEAVDFQFESYVGRLSQRALKGLVDNMLMDSWECRSQTWTEFMPQAFRAQSGYDLKMWIPALFGFVLDNQETTSRFLCDWRQTQNHLFVNNFYGRMAQNAHRHGMTIQYETAAGDIFPGDPMEYFKWADVPMTEFWQPFSHFLANHNYKPIRPTASAARMYGKPRVSAESFTSFDLNWDERLSMLREVANQNILEGVSHFVFHTYTHNPAADSLRPGTSFGDAIGTPFLRGQTWWPYMRSFTRYLARCTYMLERGNPVSDVLWYLGDEIQQKPNQYAPFPEGYRYDYCNTDVLLNRLDVKDGRWITPEGISYSVMWIPEDVKRLLPQTIKRMEELVKKGGILVGNPPLSPATLLSGGAEKAFYESVQHLWSKYPERVLCGLTLEQALQRLQIRQDVKPTQVQWLHRRTENADWYMVCAPMEKPFKGEVEFLCQGHAELWNPMRGIHEPIGVTEMDGYSRVHLEMERGECFFIVFSHGGKKQKITQQTCTAMLLQDLKWTLAFPQGWGIEEQLQLETLKPWKELDLTAEGKAFSGTAEYTATMNLPHKELKERYELDLGKVEQIAVLKVNGQVVDTLWAPPYTADVTEFLRRGKNEINVSVTSTWFNRLVYDAAQPVEKRRTWTLAGPKGNQALRESGLLGPVQLKTRRK